MSSKEMAQGYELFNELVNKLLLTANNPETIKNTFNDLWQKLETEGSVDILKAAIDSMNQLTQYGKDYKYILLNYPKNIYTESTLTPSIPSKEAVQSYLSEASLNKMYAFIGSAALAIHGYFNSFSDSNLYNNLSGEQPEQEGAL